MKKSPTLLHMLQLYTLLVVAFLLSSVSAMSQSPGGIKSPEAWFKVVPTTNDLQYTYKWQDFCGDDIKLNNYDSRGAGYGTEFVSPSRASTQMRVQTYNFNPAINFTEANYSSKEILLSKTNLSQGMVIGVWGSYYSDFDVDKYLYSINGRPGDGIFMTKDKVIESKESVRSLFNYGETEGDDLMFSANDREKTLNKWRERALRVQSYYRLNKPNYSDVWGERQKAVISMGYYFDPNSVNNSSTFDINNYSGRYYFFGYVPEIIVYNRMLTPLERLRVETYLAIKYGFALNTSYINSSDKLIWDYAANSTYNNRITGISKDDASALTQPISTTSYEEAPNYSDIYANDTYDQSNCYYRSNRNRLLVMGRPYGTNMKDGEYTIWGDDDNSFHIPSSPRIIGGMKTMPRNWKVRSNIASAPKDGSIDGELWSCSNMQMISGTYLHGFTKEAKDNTTTGTAYTKLPLSGSNGYFSWTTAAGRGPVTIKFGTQTPTLTAGSNDYGYYIGLGGSIYPVVAGVRSANDIGAVGDNQKIEIEKNGNRISIRKNGFLITNQDIIIKPEDADKTFYGTIMLEKGNGDLKLSNFVSNGFYYGNKNYNSSGDHRIELSYLVANELTNYRNNGQAYLIVDRSGTGTYPPGATEFYASDETDDARSKIIFNNIFWDKDGNGSDVFTFGYIDAGKLAFTADAINPTCNDNAQPNKDGSIKIGVQTGLRGYNYNIVNTADASIKSSGQFFSDALRVDALPAGTYNISLNEIGGCNLQSTGSASFNPTALSTNYARPGWCCWSVNWLAGGLSRDGSTLKDNGATVGFKASPLPITAPSSGFASADYGILKTGNDLYAIVHATAESTPFYQVKTGDAISIEKSSNTLITYKVNGTVITTRNIQAADQSMNFYAVVTLAPGQSADGANEVCNFQTLPSDYNSWTLSDNITAKRSALANATATATLAVNCTLPPAPSPALAMVAPDPHLNIYYGTSNLMTFKVKVTLDRPGNSQLLVFDMSGQLVYKTQLMNNQKEQQISITLQTPGMYVVKAITPEGEFSKQVIVQ
jgi:hypothetical protein